MSRRTLKSRSPSCFRTNEVLFLPRLRHNTLLISKRSFLSPPGVPFRLLQHHFAAEATNVGRPLPLPPRLLHTPLLFPVPSHYYCKSKLNQAKDAAAPAPSYSSPLQRVLDLCACVGKRGRGERKGGEKLNHCSGGGGGGGGEGDGH